MILGRAEPGAINEGFTEAAVAGRASA
jgi:hypothetical protein